MPTSAARRERTFEARATVILVAGLMVLVLLGFARIYTVTHDLKATQVQLVVAQAKACQLRRAGRANVNVHERIPLRAAFAYLGGIVVKSAEAQPDPAKRAAALEFGRRFLRYADQIVPLTNPPCPQT